jgi:hypothetical protein
LVTGNELFDNVGEYGLCERLNDVRGCEEAVTGVVVLEALDGDVTDERCIAGRCFGDGGTIVVFSLSSIRSVSKFQSRELGKLRVNVILALVVVVLARRCLGDGGTGTGIDPDAGKGATAADDKVDNPLTEALCLDDTAVGGARGLVFDTEIALCDGDV